MHAALAYQAWRPTSQRYTFPMMLLGNILRLEELLMIKRINAFYERGNEVLCNILNPFSPFVSKKIEEILEMNIPIDIIAPSHGAIWRDNPLQRQKVHAMGKEYQEDQITII